MAMLMVFADSGQLLPSWVNSLLRIAVVFCFTMLAFPTEPKLPKTRKREVYLNSPKPSTTKSASDATEHSRNLCRSLYQEVKTWKQENPYASWDHVEAVQIFNRFSDALDEHTDTFQREWEQFEVQQWIAYANEIRRNQN